MRYLAIITLIIITLFGCKKREAYFTWEFVTPKCNVFSGSDCKTVKVTNRSKNCNRVWWEDSAPAGYGGGGITGALFGGASSTVPQDTFRVTFAPGIQTITCYCYGKSKKPKDSYQVTIVIN